MPPNRPLILASASPYRQALLQRLGLPFGIAAPAIDETALAGERPAETAVRLAEAKARAVAPQYPTALLIGCDQIAQTGSCRTALVDVASTFRHLDDATLAAYLERERPFDCAGSVKAEGLGIALFTRLASDDPTALIGLPLIRLTDLLEAEGVRPVVAAG